MTSDVRVTERRCRAQIAADARNTLPAPNTADQPHPERHTAIQPPFDWDHAITHLDAMITRLDRRNR